MKPQINKIFLSLGSNSGCRKENLERALELLVEKITVLKKSSFYETQPWGKFGAEEVGRGKVFKHGNQRQFLNMAVGGMTGLAPEKLLEFIQEIERKLGRERSAGRLQAQRKYHSRPIDIDILFYNGLQIKASNLTIPHPQIPYRKFVLQPLAEIAPDCIHPILKKTAQELLNECADTSIVRLTTRANRMKSCLLRVPNTIKLPNPYKSK